MASHIVNGEFQSDKYPTCPPGKVPLSVKDPMAQDLLWEYAERRRAVDSDFASDLQEALQAAGFEKHEVEFVHGGDLGWVRIGRYDSARRRSLWCRLVGEDDMGNVQAIELCSGREGDDGYIKLTPADPQWEAICNLLLRVEGDCGKRTE